MAKKPKRASDRRDHHKQRNDWVVIDLRRVAQAFETLRADPRHASWSAHDGKCLEAAAKDVIVERVLGAYSERMARMLAANGGNWSKLAQNKRIGLAKSTKYWDPDKFAVVEIAVFVHWKESPRIDWNAQAAREELYRRHGVNILPRLSTAFVPPGESVEDYQPSLPGTASEEERFPDMVRGKRRPPGPRARPAKPRAFCVVDLEGYMRGLDQAAMDSFHAEINPTGQDVGHGQVLKRATVGKPIGARDWRAALDAFRARQAGDVRDALPEGRFLSVSLAVWSQAVSLECLPFNLSRESLASAVRRARQQAAAAARLARRSAKYDFLKRVEPGLDDLKQFPLPGVLTLRELFEFPPREPKPRPRLCRLPRRKYRGWPLRLPVADMVQLELPFRYFDPYRDRQCLLFGPQVGVGRPPHRREFHSWRKRVPVGQCRLKF